MSSPARFMPLGGTAGSLARYRVLAMIVGTGLATLCFVGLPLQYLVHNRWPWTAVVEIVGPIHGVFYMIYLLACLDLAARARFRTVQLLGMVGAGLVPLLAFYMEHKVSQRVKAQLALGEDAPPGPAASFWAVVTRRPGTFRPLAAPAGGGDRAEAGEVDERAGEGPVGDPAPRH